MSDEPPSDRRPRGRAGWVQRSGGRSSRPTTSTHAASAEQRRAGRRDAHGASTASWRPARPSEALRDAADDLERAGRRVRAATRRAATYEGFAEAANAGGTSRPFFDHSPLIGRANPLAPPIEHPGRGRPRSTAGSTFGAPTRARRAASTAGYVAAAFDEVLGATQSLAAARA